MPTKPELAPPDVSTRPLVSVRDLQVHFALRTSALARLFGGSSGVVKAVNGVNFDLAPGEVLGLVGESGSGKSTLGRALLGLVHPSGGSIKYRDQEIARLQHLRQVGELAVLLAVRVDVEHQQPACGTAGQRRLGNQLGRQVEVEVGFLHGTAGESDGWAIIADPSRSRRRRPVPPRASLSAGRGDTPRCGWPRRACRWPRKGSCGRCRARDSTAHRYRWRTGPHPRGAAPVVRDR